MQDTTELVIWVWRHRTPEGISDKDKKIHEERYTFLRDLFQELNQEVRKWDGADDLKNPRELVVIVVAFSSVAAVAKALTSLKAWMDSDKTTEPQYRKRNVEVELPGGDRPSLRGFPDDQIPIIAQAAMRVTPEQ